jgi:hypothetical protein
MGLCNEWNGWDYRFSICIFRRQCVCAVLETNRERIDPNSCTVKEGCILRCQKLQAVSSTMKAVTDDPMSLVVMEPRKVDYLRSIFVKLL